ncbi:MAG: hypothetical protein AAGK17_05860 [Pseudomonadota bacterium]
MRMIVGFWALLATVLLAGCAESSPPAYRYRLTVEVETPEGLKTGSSVIEVETRVSGRNSIPTPGAVRFRARGEAVAVDLPVGKTLFALLWSEKEVDWAGSIMYLFGPKYSGDDGVRRSIAEMKRNPKLIILPPVKPLGRGGAIRRDGWPMLVTFGDEADPTSVAKVDPDDLAASFGEGVKLKRITAQITNDPITTGIEKRLGWLPEYYNRQLSGDRYQMLKTKIRDCQRSLALGHLAPT